MSGHYYGKCKATLTVFFAMSMTMFMSMVFSVLELLHVKLLNLQKEIVASVAVESAFADYNRMLWDDYGILALDCGYGSGASQLSIVEGRMEEYARVAASQPGKGVNLYRMSLEGCSISEFGLASDDFGAPLIREGARYALENLGQQAIESLREEYDKSNTGDKKTVDEYLRDAQKAGEEAEELASASSGEETEGEGETVTPVSEPPADPPDNPIETIIKLKDQAILAQVLGQDTKISTGVFSVEDPPSKRTLAAGNMKMDDSISATDRLLFADYSAQYLGSFREPARHPGLRYEREYLAFGRDSDEKNLSEMASRLLLAREAENLVSLAADPIKMKDAFLLATAIIGWTGVEPLVTALQLGIVAAWAYVESVLDVRLILAGGRVPAVKSPADWVSDIYKLPAYFPVEVRAKDSPSGLDYGAYLAVFTALCSQKDLGLRFMDILEDALHSCEDYAAVRCDNLVVAMKAECTMTSEPVFFNLIPYDWGDPGTYHIRSARELCYY